MFQFTLPSISFWDNSPNQTQRSCFLIVAKVSQVVAFDAAQKSTYKAFEQSCINLSLNIPRVSTVNKVRTTLFRIDDLGSSELLSYQP